MPNPIDKTAEAPMGEPDDADDERETDVSDTETDDEEDQELVALAPSDLGFQLPPPALVPPQPSTMHEID